MNLLPVILSGLLLGRLWVLERDFSVGASLVDFVGFYSTSIVLIFGRVLFGMTLSTNFVFGCFVAPINFSVWTY